MAPFLGFSLLNEWLMSFIKKNENVSTEVLCKICKALQCQVEDIMELVDEERIVS